MPLDKAAEINVHHNRQTHKSRSGGSDVIATCLRKRYTTFWSERAGIKDSLLPMMMIVAAAVICHPIEHSRGDFPPQRLSDNATTTDDGRTPLCHEIALSDCP